MKYYFKNRYENAPLTGIVTTSLYGKSIQYEQLKELKLVGYTKGNSVCHIQPEVTKLCKEYLKDEHNITINDNFLVLQKAFDRLGLDKHEYLSSNPKGIYFGYLGQNKQEAKDFLCNKIDSYEPTGLKNVQEIFNEWKGCAKWRWNYLNNNSKLRKK